MNKEDYISSAVGGKPAITAAQLEAIIIEHIKNAGGEYVTFAEIKNLFPSERWERIINTLKAFKKRGILQSKGEDKKSSWRLTPD